MTTTNKSLRAQWADRTARRAALRALRRLDARTLEDIGMNRADVEIRFG